jgi:hypothetical protein
MKLNTSILLAISALSAAAISSSDESATVVDVIHRRDQTTTNWTTVICTNHFYTTDISMASEHSLSCNTTELQAIGMELDRAYDEVVNEDGALSELELQTSVCPVANNVQRNLQEAGKGGATSPERELALKKKVFIWSGEGKCKLCPPDDSDRRMTVEDHAPDDEQDHHVTKRELREAYSVIDFNTLGDGTPMPFGQNYVKDEWLAKYGLQITIEGNAGALSTNKARVYDSTNPIGHAKYLGSPNQKCLGGGAGRGRAGVPGAVGENCIPQGIVLLAENPTESLVFTFASPTRIGHLALMNVYFGKHDLQLVTPQGKNVSVAFYGLGNNGVQLVHVDQVVKQIKIHMGSMGAVTEVGIFTPTQASQALSPEARSYIQNKDALAEYIPYLEFDLSYYLTRRVNDIFGRITSSCLFHKWVNIEVQMDSVANLPRTTC